MEKGDCSRATIKGLECLLHSGTRKDELHLSRPHFMTIFFTDQVVRVQVCNFFKRWCDPADGGRAPGAPSPLYPPPPNSSNNLPPLVVVVVVAAAAVVVICHVAREAIGHACVWRCVAGCHQSDYPWLLILARIGQNPVPGLRCHSGRRGHVDH